MKPRDQYERPIDWVLDKAAALGMSQTDFATNMGVSPAVVSAWKVRPTGMPARYHEQAARVLHCSIQELLGIPSPRGPPSEWPFPDVPYSVIEGLSKPDRMRIQASMLETLTEIELSRREKNLRRFGRSKPATYPGRNRKGSA